MLTTACAVPVPVPVFAHQVVREAGIGSGAAPDFIPAQSLVLGVIRVVDC
jgi:hypothetical protein